MCLRAPVPFPFLLPLLLSCEGVAITSSLLLPALVTVTLAAITKNNLLVSRVHTRLSFSQSLNAPPHLTL